MSDQEKLISTINIVKDNSINNFYIEAGAHNGIFQSNTLELNQKHKWKGLLVEPTPETYNECLKNRPNDIIENCALVGFDYPNSIINLTKFNQSAYNTTCKFYNKKLEPKIIEPISVPARTLTSILDQHNCPRTIDFFSLDVEGDEDLVLNGIDFSKYHLRFILIELLMSSTRHMIFPYFNSEIDPPSKMAGAWRALKILKSKGYRPHSSNGSKNKDWLFQKE